MNKLSSIFKRNRRSDSDSASSSKPKKIFPTGIKAFAIPENPESAVVDIVFIHGLTGDREKTWTAKGSSPWPQTLLPAEVPCARILTFGYDARVVDLKEMISKNKIGDHAGDLVNALTRYRDKDNTSQRPVIFVAHSLGGLVCEDALLKSKSRAESHLNHIVSCTKGILFLGTPHGGSGLADWAESLARYIGLIKQTNNSILGVLKADSEVLDRIQEAFHEMIAGRKATQPIAITCFYEQLPLLGIGTVVPKYSATIPGYNSIGIHSNHMDMTKFDAGDDPGFESVVGELCRWVKELKSLPAARRVDPGKTKPLFLVPFDQDRYFIGRSSILDSIGNIFKQSRRVALRGIGGVGKSQIAIEYCYRFKDLNPQANIFWIYCDTVERIFQAYKNIARRLMLPGWDDPKTNTLQMVLEWLNDKDHGTWLIILDNADDDETFFKAQLFPVERHEPVALNDYLPRSPNGYILVTTRDSRVGTRLTDREQPIDVSELDSDEAYQLLKSKLPNCENDVKNVYTLLERLERLPLAITQAAAFIDENKISVAKYIDMLRVGDLELVNLLDKEELVDHRRDSKSSSSVMQTWKISFDQIQRQHQRAAHILSLMALLDRQGIPKLLLRNDDERESDFVEAIGVLKAFSLINSENEGELLFLHPLVQVFTQNWLELQGKRKEFEGEALQLLSIKFPNGEFESWELCDILLPHAHRVLICNFSSDTSLLHRATLLYNLACYQDEHGDYHHAHESSMKSYTEREKLLGEEHPDTLMSVDKFAMMLNTLGKYEDAEKLHRKTLEIRQRVMGKENQDALMSMSNLAAALSSQRKFEEAEELCRKTLTIRQKVLGKDHLDTLVSMNNLSYLLNDQGKYEEAEELIRQTLERHQRVLSKEHPHTLGTMNNLSFTLNGQGKYEEAEVLFRQTLELCQRVLGKEHPNTLTIMNNLALVLYHRGKYEEAEELFRQTLEPCQRVLGKEHPNTLILMNNLAEVLGNQGNYKEAEMLYRQMLELCQRVLGKNHPNTLKLMKNLAYCLDRQCKYEEAEELRRMAVHLLHPPP